MQDERSGNSLRAMLWKLFLQTTALDASAYLELVARGPCDPVTASPHQS